MKPRNTPSPSIRKLMEETQGVPIKNIKVGRKPIMSNVEKVMNILSFGKLNKTKKKLGIDDIYHNYLILELTDGRKIKIEKNHVVESKNAGKEDYSNEIHDIPIDKHVDIKSLLDTASRGDKDFWYYNAANNNCQVFTKEVVERNGLQPNDKATKEVLNPQDGESLINSLGALKGIPNIVTDLAAGADRAIYGNGVKRNITVKQIFDYVNAS